MTRHIIPLLLATIAGTAVAQAPVIDGSAVGDESFYDADPGTPGLQALSVQNTRTGFGDNSLDDPILNQGGGNEINQVFATIANDGTQNRLYVLITGNLEGGNLGAGGGNFNKLQVFIDSEAGGVNTIDGASLPTQFDGFCCGENLGSNTPDADGGLQRIDGLTFDPGFNADYTLAFTHGGESVGGANFWAVSSHFADLTPGEADGQPDVGGLGIQLAPRGAPAALRFPDNAAPGDYNNDDIVNASDYTAFRDSVGQPLGTLPNDESGADPIGQPQFDQFTQQFGAAGLSPGDLSDFPFVPNLENPTDTLTQVPIPGLGQGELIDQTFATTQGGCGPDGSGCAASEFQFTLPVLESEPDNASNQRNFLNFVDLELGFDNSNTGGVIGPVDGDFEVGSNLPDDIESEDPTEVLTGVEFSIPLDEIGDPTDDIRLTVFINGGEYNFISNQFGGEGVVSTAIAFPADFDGGNLGNTTIISSDGTGPLQPVATLGDFVGDQFVTVPGIGAAVSGATVPEPGAALLVGVGVLGLLAPRRRI